MAVNGVAALLNAVWAFVLIRTGRSQKSPALVADGQHIMTDVVTSVGVLAGLVGAIATGWHMLDPLLAMLVALNILWQGWKVVGSSLDGLMDRAVGTDEHMRIRDIISANSKGAIEVHDLKTRIAGRATFIEFHLVVDHRHERRRKPRHLRPHRGGAEGRNPVGARHHPCRARRRGQAAARHARPCRSREARIATPHFATAGSRLAR